MAKETERTKGNGRDGGEAILGLRVTAAAVKETKEGSTTATITIVGRARNMVKMVGQQVNVVSGGGSRKHHGDCRSVTVKAKNGKREVTVKVDGGREMDQLVGLQVEIEEAEPNLPGVEDEPGRGKEAQA